MYLECRNFEEAEVVVLVSRACMLCLFASFVLMKPVVTGRRRRFEGCEGMVGGLMGRRRSGKRSWLAMPMALLLCVQTL